MRPRRNKNADKAEEARRSRNEKEPTLADDKENVAVNPETGEPRLLNGLVTLVLSTPEKFGPIVVGAAIIKSLDQLALSMTVEVRRRQPELQQVFQLYAAERPSILERQKRLLLRRNQG